MYHKVGLTAAFRLVNQVMKKEKPLLMDAKKWLYGYCFATQPSLLLTIKHKLTLFRMSKVYPTFPIGALTKSEGRDMAELFDMKNCGAIALRL
jgi:hypothetical protein